MGKRTPSEVYNALIAAGFPPASAVTMTAISGAESSWRDDAVGDTHLTDNTWGPSYGAFQIRTRKADTGRGTARDIMALTGDLAAQARAAWEISRHGADFSPWTVYNTKRYEDFLGQAAAAAGRSSPATDRLGWGPDWLPWNAAGNAAGEVLSEVRGISLQAAAVVFGLALVGVGLVRLAAPALSRGAQQAGRAVKAVL